MKIALYVAGGLVAAFLILVAVEAIKGPRTYLEIADAAAQRCIDRGGVGTDWRGSSGVKLETYCKSEAYMKAFSEMCEKNPASC